MSGPSEVRKLNRQTRPPGESETIDREKLPQSEAAAHVPGIDPLHINKAQDPVQCQSHQADARFRRQEADDQLSGAIGKLQKAVLPPPVRILFQHQVPRHPDGRGQQRYQRKPEGSPVIFPSKPDPPQTLGSAVHQSRLRRTYLVYITMYILN